MTDAKRGAMLLLLGLFTAVLLYPALHEGGHILVTLLLGGRIREVRLGAAASVLCGGLRHGELAAVAFGGVGLPLVLAMLLRPKHFPLWYVVQLVKGISVLAILLSLISLIGCKYGVIVENDDIMNAVRLWPEGRGVCLVLLCAGLLLSVGSICAARPLLLADFMNAKLHCGRLDHSGGLSSSYVRSMMLLVLDIMEFAAAEGLCPPVKTTLQTPAANRREVVILDTDALRRLETYLLAKPDITGTGILISLHTGLRISEVCALRWEDIDFRKAVLHVRSTVARVRGTDGGTATRLIIDTPKTKSSLRDIPLSRQLMAVLLPLYEKRRSEYVISDKSGFVSPRTYEYRFHRVLDRCGLPSINYHALRHTFATRCIELGVDVKTLSEILGHANVSTTLNTYVHSSMERKREQLEKLFVESY